MAEKLIQAGDGTATDKVLNTYELLENILLSLPPADILLAANACKTWDTVISTSIPITKALREKTNKESVIYLDKGKWFVSIPFEESSTILIRRTGKKELVGLLPKPHSPSHLPGLVLLNREGSSVTFEKKCDWDRGSGWWINVIDSMGGATNLGWIKDGEKEKGMMGWFKKHRQVCKYMNRFHGREVVRALDD